MSRLAKHAEIDCFAVDFVFAFNAVGFEIAFDFRRNFFCVFAVCVYSERADVGHCVYHDATVKTHEFYVLAAIGFAA